MWPLTSRRGCRILLLISSETLCGKTQHTAPHATLKRVNIRMPRHGVPMFTEVRQRWTPCMPQSTWQMHTSRLPERSASRPDSHAPLSRQATLPPILLWPDGVCVAWCGNDQIPPRSGTSDVLGLCPESLSTCAVGHAARGRGYLTARAGRRFTSSTFSSLRRCIASNTCSPPLPPISSGLPSPQTSPPPSTQTCNVRAPRRIRRVPPLGVGRIHPHPR